MEPPATQPVTSVVDFCTWFVHIIRPVVGWRLNIRWDLDTFHEHITMSLHLEVFYMGSIPISLTLVEGILLGHIW